MSFSLEQFLQALEPTHTKLVAVSKTHTPEEILVLYRQGQRDFGENRVQELVPKWEEMPKDIRWHAIGHLQTNKVKYIASFIYMIHSVDSLKLLQEIDKEAGKAGRLIPCLLQMHIAEEETKFGLDRQELLDLLEAPEFSALKYVEVRGLMGMATFTENEDQVRKEFRQLHTLFEEVKTRFFAGSDSFRELSMGMSSDYHIAMEEGSTMVRVGSLLFGPRHN
ncbi:MAG: YggS family pyridoxal phosphate-dependent enzyme [Saprospirales bacterium]|nr:YggS family pyridoxal phosphate-dependent enzyme [Saprospirales bacterium]MBK8492277.1 YggS family pyridoxal phosphate-dependent enzyme [Saprospirales bacterium]